MTVALDVTSAYPWYRLRETAYDAIYVSPHMDDAVYSCGGRMALARAAGERILIVTLFGTGLDDERGRGLFDNIVQRKREERAAADLLDVDHLFLNLPDFLFRKKRPVDWVRYAVTFGRLPETPLRRRTRAALQAIIRRLLASGGRVYFPLAIGGHPDHRETYELGRALHGSAPRSVLFYEDIPYAQVNALRSDRLRQLGLPVASPSSLGADARELGAFVLMHERGARRLLGQALLASHLAGVRLLKQLSGSRDPIAARLSERELDITSVIDLKVAAMRAYVTQTAHFFPAGEALYDVLVRRGERYVERVWELEADASERAEELDPELVDQELARVASLQRSEQR